MSVAKKVGRSMLWLMIRGVALGVALAAVFPTAEAVADCDCHDYGLGDYSCSSGNASSCSSGGQTCDVTCI